MKHLPGHPIALIKNNCVTHLINVDSHEEAVINQVLSRFTFDEFVNCCFYGRELFQNECKDSTNRFTLDEQFNKYKDSIRCCSEEMI